MRQGDEVIRRRVRKFARRVRNCVRQSMANTNVK